MQDQNEITKINEFLSVAAPFVISRVKMLLQSAGLEVKEEGSGADLAFLIESGRARVKFFPYNMLLEIVTVNRNEKPLRFDENVEQFGYFLAKTAHIAESKLRVIFQTLGEDDLGVAIENICQGTKSDERIHIWRFDQDTPSPARHRRGLSAGRQEASAYGRRLKVRAAARWASQMRQAAARHCISKKRTMEINSCKQKEVSITRNQQATG